MRSVDIYESSIWRLIIKSWPLDDKVLFFCWIITIEIDPSEVMKIDRGLFLGVLEFQNLIEFHVDFTDVHSSAVFAFTFIILYFSLIIIQPASYVNHKTDNSTRLTKSLLKWIQKKT